jgi:N4-(beta-N-acetylglucosaminyl)-L-asparaginase
VISSSNGNKFKNGGPLTAVETAFKLITGGKDVLEALIAGVNILELDPEETSVGYGGLPNADGVVQLDSCCMHGPLKRAGGVAAIEGVRTPSLVAHAVMQNTDHHLIVGRGATEFARHLRFKIEDDLNTEKSRKLWLEWKRRVEPERYLDPAKRVAAGYEAGRQMAAEGLIDRLHLFGTINCNGIGTKGEICGVTTTSGMAFKIPGRVGDSPILGAGSYVDNAVGAACATGVGELTMRTCASFAVVERMRAGAEPAAACAAVLEWILGYAPEVKRDPRLQLAFIAMNKRGQVGAAVYRKQKKVFRYALAQGRATPALHDVTPLLAT